MLTKYIEPHHHQLSSCRPLGAPLPASPKDRQVASSAALVAHAWEDIAPLQHEPWLGRLLASALLRSRLKTRTHLSCLNSGLRAKREHHRAHGRTEILPTWLAAFTAAAEQSLKDHDRWLLAKSQLERKLIGRRSTSHLPALIEFVIARPIVTAGTIAKELRISPRAAQNLVAELGLREFTGRRTYRVWGVT
jgi:hypothetical protein